MVTVKAFYLGKQRSEIKKERKYSMDGELFSEQLVWKNSTIMMYTPFLDEKNGDGRM